MSEPTTYEVVWSETVTYRTTIVAYSVEQAREDFDNSNWDYEPKRIYSEIDGGPDIRPVKG